MSLVSICFVGKDNEPLYLRDFTSENKKQTNDEVESAPHDPFGFFDEPETTTISGISGISGSNSTADNDSGGCGANSGNTGNETTQLRPPNCSLHYQFLMHASLDRFEELTGPSSGNNNRWRTPGSTGNDAMWVGLLCPVDDFRVYGYLTTTNIKLIGIVSVEDDHAFGQDLLGNSSSSGNSGDNNGSGGKNSKREAELKTMFANIHALYVEYTLNPFTKLKSQIKSRRFDEGIERLISAFNESKSSYT